jgi:hypothetical protein
MPIKEVYITPEKKDIVVSSLVSRGERRFTLDLLTLLNQGINLDEADIVIRELHSSGYIKCNGHLSCREVTLNSQIFDLHRRGGFVGLEEILKANLEKLNGELLLLSSELNPTLKERVVNIANIASSIVSFLRLIQ